MDGLQNIEEKNSLKELFNILKEHFELENVEEVVKRIRTIQDKLETV